MADKVLVIGVDETEHSFYALRWMLQHFFGPNDIPHNLVIVHAKPPPSSVLAISGPGAENVLPLLDEDLKKIGNRTVQRAKEICIEHKVQNVTTEVVEGDARNVMCDAVEKHHASLLVVGSHNYGVVKGMNLGSVSAYCAHHAHCSVMIVKRPPKPME
ncbi:universal stress protein PHOS34-like [Cucurbita maxima]|uniref:Universal stress protein PHOS34-like n=1 Tax=Cucurbita maxima TaxID=3661 RepID=A0A6J1IBY1_CUCMA|nr:universal stress protein PHOS34-like [Cucurbita maxima]XP_022975168.1 universal stress protein PHOS34-like [Cucurbita maxima]